MNRLQKLKLAYMDYDRFFDSIFIFLGIQDHPNRFLQELNMDYFLKVNILMKLLI